jgi:hypothetical protein
MVKNFMRNTGKFFINSEKFPFKENIYDIDIKVRELT